MAKRVAKPEGDDGEAELSNGGTVAPLTTMVIFGASGDLTSRKLMPALAELNDRGFLPPGFTVVGVARTEMSEDDFRSRMLEAVPKAPKSWREATSRFRFVSGDYGAPATFKELRQVLGEVDAAGGVANRLFYIAAPPSTFPPIVLGLGGAELNVPTTPDGAVRMVIEKPYGRDIHSATALDATVHSVFDESQVFRIDHYLGKETVQNLLALRFSNTIFEPLWNRNFVDHVEITVAETLGVGHRGGFYEEAGALRDIVQNHVMQVLALTLMEPPSSMDATGIRDEKVKALRAVVSFDTSTVERSVVSASTTSDSSTARRVWRTAKRRESAPVRAPRRSSPCNCKSTTGAGRACPSTCARASAWPSRSPRWPCTSVEHRTFPSARRCRSVSSRTR